MTIRTLYKIAVFGILLLLTSWILKEFAFNDAARLIKERNQLEQGLNKSFTELESKIERLGDTLQSKGITALFDYGVEDYVGYENQGVSLFIFDNESNLKFWSSNKYITPNYNDVNGFYKRRNGWYLLRNSKYNDYNIVAQFWIKKDFGFSNKYVQNEFHSSLNVHSDWTLSWEKLKGAYEVEVEGLSQSIFIVPPPSFDLETHVGLIILDSVGLLTLVIAGFLIARKLSLMKRLVYFVPVFVTLRALLLYFDLPAGLNDLDLFSSQSFYLSNYIPSLGDLILHLVFLLIVLSVFFYRAVEVKIESSSRQILLGILVLSVLFTVFWYAVYFIDLLPSYTKEPINLSHILSIETQTIFCLICIAMVIGVLSLLIWNGLNWLKNIGVHFHFVVISSSIIAVSMFVVSGILEVYSFSYSFYGLGIITLFAYWVFELKGKLSFPLILSLLLIYTVLSSGLTQEVATAKNTHEKKQLLAKLGKEKDAVLEYLFPDLASVLAVDSTLISMSSNYEISSKIIAEYLQYNHLKNYWQNYDVQVHPCFPGDSLLTNAMSDPISCNRFFDTMIDSIGEESIANLFHLRNNNGRISYLGLIEFGEGKNIYLELDSKLKPDGLGFPILLLDQQAQRKALDANFSFAHFKKNDLVKQKGDFNYSTNLQYYTVKNEPWYIFDQDGWQHLVRFNGEDVYFLSEKVKGTWDQLAAYSYLFALFSIFAFLVFVISKLVRSSTPFSFNFKTRFQLVIVFLLFFSTLFIGVGSVFYLKNQYNQKNFDAISEKIKSVKIEIEGKLGQYENSTKFDVDQVDALLYKFSNIFFTDINLYYPNGEVISSSQNQVFEKGLVSDRIHPLALYEMLFNSQTQFVQIENIEGMQYLSAYVPFFNKKGTLLGYLNLPYFARTNDLKNEISNFIVALLNIYALLIVIALVIGLLLTNRLTQPLRLIQEKMSEMKLGATNELINYSGKDEIGRLVNEYNRMVVEITESANRLAETEREGAWREMAKQVAHEIKNPLTPMKLTTQHLQMRWGTFSEAEKNERFGAFAQNLIQQIETLSAIASEFSSFAKLPETKLSDVELRKVIESSVDVYNGTNGVDVVLEASDNYIVEGDKDQLLRVFNNLIKNAIQAIPKNQEGWVKIKITAEETHLLISVKDNGQGIPPDSKSKIFVPNFTTKTSGMGLGLAMVQKIIENMGGKIYFESELNCGTQFFIQLPKKEGI